MSMYCVIWSEHILNRADFTGDCSSFEEVKKFEEESQTSVSSSFEVNDEQHAVEIVNAFYNETDIEVFYKVVKE